MATLMKLQKTNPRATSIGATANAKFNPITDMEDIAVFKAESK